MPPVSFDISVFARSAAFCCASRTATRTRSSSISTPVVRRELLRQSAAEGPRRSHFVRIALSSPVPLPGCPSRLKILMVPAIPAILARTVAPELARAHQPPERFAEFPAPPGGHVLELQAPLSLRDRRLRCSLPILKDHEACL